MLSYDNLRDRALPVLMTRASGLEAILHYMHFTALQDLG